MKHLIFPVARLSTAMAAATVLFVTGCASPTPPASHLALARSAITEAQSVGGPDAAPLEFRSAQDKLSRANAAARNEQYADAALLAEAAEADARLAEAKARNAKAQQMAAELNTSNRTLERELNRQMTAPATGGAR